MTTKKQKRLLIEVAGWYGAIAILAAYSLVSLGVLNSNGLVFQLLNLTGAVGMLVDGIFKDVKQVVILNGFWIAIAAIALYRILFS